MKSKVYGYINIVLILLLSLLFKIPTFASEQSQNTILYFYSPTCSTCNDIKIYMKDLKDVNIYKYNIVQKENKSFFNYLCEEYNIPVAQRTVPLVFVGEKWISGKNNIITNLEKQIKEVQNYIYPNFNQKYNFDNDLSIMYSRNYSAIFLIGFINGLNPCSLAILILLMSIIVTQNKKKIMSITLIYIVSKYLTFLLLGTILYKFLSFFNINRIEIYLKIILILIICILLIGNILDYINIKKQRFDKIILQLPKSIRNFNQKALNTYHKFNNSLFVYLLIFILSSMISTTEFLCTGQIYLISIVTIFQYVKTEMVRALTYLIIYNIGMILPVFFLAIIISKGKDILDISEKVFYKTPFIKLVNAVLLLIFITVVILFM